MHNEVIISRFSHPILSGTVYGKGFFVFAVSLRDNADFDDKFRCLGFSLREGDLCAKDEIVEYLNGERKCFSVRPMLLWGTPFQRRIWCVLRTIPFGKVATYGQVASTAGDPDAPRAVGQALAENPIPIIIPCHRVLSKKGLGGFIGGVDIKRQLLELEGVFPKERKI